MPRHSEEKSASATLHCEPFWWQETQHGQSNAAHTAPLPPDVDVLVIGSGYTGLHAALETARAGLSTLVVDAKGLGHGCSSRNGGQVSAHLKEDYSGLTRKYGDANAQAMLREGAAALTFLEDFIATESIQCDWHRCGHFSGAHNPAALNSSVRQLARMPTTLGLRWEMISRSQQHREIGTDQYHGGIVFPDHAALQPALYQAGLLERVRSAGARIVDYCAVTSVVRHDKGFTVSTTRGELQARQVAVATNGYTGGATPWHQRRIIPIGSYMIATAPVAANIAAQIAPTGRTMTDTRRLVFYYRMYRHRMIFGGRVALAETDPRRSAPRLYAEMVRLFPQLQGTPVEYSWMGFVGYTFDTLPHIGSHSGLHYAMGYCGSGVALSSYLGSIMGSQIADAVPRKSVFLDLNFPTRPLYTGRPWFLQPSVLYYRIRDRLNF